MLRFEIIHKFEKKITDPRGLSNYILNYIPSRLVSVSFYVHVLIVHVFEYSYNLFVIYERLTIL